MEKEIESIQKLYTFVIEFFVNYSFQVVGALLIILLGWFVAKWASRAVVRLCERHDVDITLRIFASNLMRMLIMAAAIIVALGKFGISIGPFIAAVGAISLSVGLALQGTLTNYGAGLGLILSRPFVVGDTVLVNNTYGVVEEIRLGYTTLRTEDEEIITIPNKHMIGEILVNSFAYRIVETTVGIDYADDPERAIETIQKVLAGFEELSKENIPLVGIEAFGDFSIDIGLRYWVPTTKYYQVQYRVNLAIFKAIKEAGITIPYPQRDIHILSGEAQA
jgi:small conductance mechanosensitive channel